MNKNAIGLRIRENKANIIAMYDNGVILQDIADEYNVVVITIYNKLRGWGVKLKKSAYKRRVKGAKKYKRNFSKEFLANQAVNTNSNNKNKRFKYFKREDTRFEFNRIRHITKQGVGSI